MEDYSIILIQIISVGFGYLFFRIVKPKIKSGKKEVYYARLLSAWSLFVSTSFTMRDFASRPSLEGLEIWLRVSIPFAIFAVIVGYLYGKFSK
tara:strand:- start:179 stop:457 length:279 start_codon:yes stop_codon:yes gene_type:complete